MPEAVQVLGKRLGTVVALTDVLLETFKTNSIHVSRHASIELPWRHGIVARHLEQGIEGAGRLERRRGRHVCHRGNRLRATALGHAVPDPDDDRQVARLVSEATKEAEATKASAEQVVADARAEAEKIIAEASEKARTLTAEESASQLSKAAKTAEDVLNKAAEEAKNKPKEPDAPVRMFYTDPKTGLPVRSVFGRASRLDRPVFKAVYTYPTDIAIEEPKDVKAP